MVGCSRRNRTGMLRDRYNHQQQLTTTTSKKTTNKPSATTAITCRNKRWRPANYNNLQSTFRVPLLMFSLSPTKGVDLKPNRQWISPTNFNDIKSPSNWKIECRCIFTGIKVMCVWKWLSETFVILIGKLSCTMAHLPYNTIYNVIATFKRESFFF